MQRVAHEQQNIHPLFDSIENFYAFASEKTTDTRWNLTVFPVSFKSVYKILNEYGDLRKNVKFVTRRYAKLSFKQYPRKNIIVCFSGGKDSVATVLYYQKRGYSVIAYHLKGINQTYKDEWKTAQLLAQKLNCKYIQEEIHLSGKHEWVEHPIKNYIIASMALQWGIRNNFSIKIAFGNYSTSYLDDDPFDVCGGDDIEMWKAYEKIIRQIIPRFHMFIPLENIQTSFTLIEKQPELFIHIQSCIGPFRYREYLHNNNEKKYKIKLLPHRCGSCWKCAVEYIYLSDHNILEYSVAFYKHCIQILRNTLKKESGIYLRSERAVWSRYFFYPIEQSRYFND